MSIFLWILLPVGLVIASLFVPKWLFWITPRAYSAFDVMREQYGGKKAVLYLLLFVLFFVVVIAVLEYGSRAGW